MRKPFVLKTFNLKHDEEEHLIDLDDVIYVSPVVEGSIKLNNTSQQIFFFKVLLQNKEYLQFSYVDEADCSISRGQVIEQITKKD